jgi:hypothetical protein
MDAYLSKRLIPYYRERHNVGILQIDIRRTRGDFEVPLDDFTLDGCVKVIRAAIFPFEPGKVTAWLSEQMLPGRKLEIEVETLRTWPFATMIDDRRLVLDPSFKVIYDIYQTIYRHYRNRPTLPVDDHIVLGEE